MSGTRPSASGGVMLIVRRELGTYFGTRAGWILMALALMVAGILFNTNAVGTSAKFSADVLGQFIHDTSGVVIGCAFLISMRAIVEERKSGTLPLLLNSSLTEGEIVFAKWIGAMSFLSCLLLLSLYIPGLVFIRGKVSFGHIATGYLGLFLFGSAIVSVGIWASSIARGWLVAGAVSAATLAVLLSLWRVARRVDGPLGDFIGAMSLHDRHFMPFRNGTLSLEHVIFYVSVTLVFLALARNGLEARRWST